MKTTHPLSLFIVILLIFGSYAYAEETQLAAMTQSTDEISEQNKANFDSLINTIESSLTSSEPSTDNQALSSPSPTIAATEKTTADNTSANTNNSPTTETKATNTENSSSLSTSIPPNNPAIIASNSSINTSNTTGVNTAINNTKTSATPPPTEKKSGFSLVEVLQLAASVASLLITIY